MLCCRFACIWSVTWLDLHDGLKQLVDVYIEELTAAYGSQRTLHVVLVIVMVSELNWCAVVVEVRRDS